MGEVIGFIGQTSLHGAFVQVWPHPPVSNILGPTQLQQHNVSHMFSLSQLFVLKLNYHLPTSYAEYTQQKKDLNYST